MPVSRMSAVRSGTFCKHATIFAVKNVVCRGTPLEKSSGEKLERLTKLPSGDCWLLMCAIARSIVLWCRFMAYGEDDGKEGPASRLAFHRDRAGHIFFYYFLYCWKTDPDPFRSALGGKKRFEYARANL